MPQHHTEKLIWEGQRTVDTAIAAVRDRQDVELDLPEDFHHAVFAHMYPDADPAALEDVDISGGAELIERIAELRGLESLAGLAAAVAETPAEVYIQSPIPKIVVRFPVQASEG